MLAELGLQRTSEGSERCLSSEDESSGSAALGRMPKREGASETQQEAARFGGEGPDRGQGLPGDGLEAMLAGV